MLIKIIRAKKLCNKIPSGFGNYKKSIINQLNYVEEFEKKKNDGSKLNELNLGMISFRETETIGEELSGLLSEINYHYFPKEKKVWYDKIIKWIVDLNY